MSERTGVAVRSITGGRTMISGSCRGAGSRRCSGSLRPTGVMISKSSGTCISSDDFAVISGSGRTDTSGKAAAGAGSGVLTGVGAGSRVTTVAATGGVAALGGCTAETTCDGAGACGCLGAEGACCPGLIAARGGSAAACAGLAGTGWRTVSGLACGGRSGRGAGSGAEGGTGSSASIFAARLWRSPDVWLTTAMPLSTTTSLWPPIRIRCSTPSLRTRTNRRLLSTAVASTTARRWRRPLPPAMKTPLRIERNSANAASTSRIATIASRAQKTGPDDRPAKSELIISMALSRFLPS